MDEKDSIARAIYEDLSESIGGIDGGYITISNPTPTPLITIYPPTPGGSLENCIIRINDSEEEIEFVRLDGISDIPYLEELNLRKENTLVRELYEQYKVAVILAHNGD